MAQKELEDRSIAARDKGRIEAVVAAYEAPAPAYGLGLRAQIVLALSMAFIASFTLLGIAMVQLTDRARNLDRHRALTMAARVLAVAVDVADREAALDGAPSLDPMPPVSASANAGLPLLLTELVAAEGAIVGIELRRSGLEPRVHGAVGLGPSVEASLASGGTVRVWLAHDDNSDGTPLARLLLLYVAITGGGILLLTYVALTYLIVRPVESVTRAAERLASRGEHRRLEVQGAAEVARLAVAFNGMADQLRRERTALEQRLVELEHATAELGRAEEQVLRSEQLASVGRLSAGVAHEIGNPLSAILGLVELLRDGDVETAERQEFLGRIYGETERIHKIIRGLLDFARQSDPEDPDESADLVQVVADALRLVTPQRDFRHVQIGRDLPSAPVWVRGAADRLTQLVLNLLLNAADAVDGEGRIRVAIGVAGGQNDGGRDGLAGASGSDEQAAPRDMAPREAADGNRAGAAHGGTESAAAAARIPSSVLLSITDDGPGIDPKIRDHLFEPFVTTKPPGEGTGLGLAVCHTIVEGLGGSIVATDADGGGACFEVRLPLASAR